MSTRTAYCVALGIATIAPAVALAGPIPAPLPPGAPLDGQTHIINVREANDGSETASSVTYTRSGKLLTAMKLPDGSFDLTISLVPGLVRCCVADEPGSDAFFLVTAAAGINLNFSSDFDAKLPQPAEDDSTFAPSSIANPHTEFRIHSDAEPASAPEPGVLGLLATGCAGLGLALGSRKRRFMG